MTDITESIPDAGLENIRKNQRRRRDPPNWTADDASPAFKRTLRVYRAKTQSQYATLRDLQEATDCTTNHQKATKHLHTAKKAGWITRWNGAGSRGQYRIEVPPADDVDPEETR